MILTFPGVTVNSVKFDEIIELMVKTHFKCFFYKCYLNRLDVFIRDDNGTGVFDGK